jgi:phosphatidate cytidylyltransferase
MNSARPVEPGGLFAHAMSPAEALASNVFCTYLALVVAILVVAGATLAVLRWGLKRDVGHAWSAYRGWLFMVPLLVGAVFLGRVATILFVTLVSVLGFKEYARATGLYRDWPMTGTVYAGIVATGLVSLVEDPTWHWPGWYGLFAVLPAFVSAAILLIPILRNRAEGQLQAIALALLGYLYIGWMFGHLAFLANARNAYGYLLYLVFAVEINDVAAFTCGKLFGRHPLRSNISPKKTWEGSLGALAVSMALPWALRFSFPDFAARELILTGLIVGITGQLGDLSMSVIKRDLGIKDMGVLISGHGGILDRIDSLIYVTPLFFHMAGYFQDFR